MKKILALTLALALSLSLAACGGGGGAASSKPAASQPAASGGASGSQGGESKGLTEAERAKEFITVGTGPTSGVYYPIGGAFATALSDWVTRPPLRPPTPAARTSPTS